MRLNKLAVLAVISMIAAAPAAAQSAAPLSPATQRAGGAGEASQLVGTTAWILAAIGLGLLIWGIIELTGDDDGPSSP